MICTKSGPLWHEKLRYLCFTSGSDRSSRAQITKDYSLRFHLGYKFINQIYFIDNYHPKPKKEMNLNYDFDRFPFIILNLFNFSHLFHYFLSHSFIIPKPQKRKLRGWRGDDLERSHLFHAYVRSALGSILTAQFTVPLSVRLQSLRFCTVIALAQCPYPIDLDKILSVGP